MILPQEIAEKVGSTYSLNDYGKVFDGLLEFAGGKFHVYLNSKGNEHLFHPRTRFTCAQELGHYLIEEHRHALLSPQLSVASRYALYNKASFLK